MVTQQLPGTPIREQRSGITVLRYPIGSGLFTAEAAVDGVFTEASVVCLFGVGHDRLARWWGPVLDAPVAADGVRLLKVGTDDDIPLRMYRQLDGVLCQTPRIASDAEAVGIPARACFPVRNGLDIDKWRNGTPSKSDARQELDVRDDAFVVVGLGRFTLRKRFGDLIQAFGAFADSLNYSGQPELVLHGSDFGQDDGDEVGLRTFARRARHPIRFIPPSIDVRVSLAAADVMVTLSEREGAPNIFIEAFATGRPVVASDLPGHRMYVRNQVHGLLVPVGDHAAAAALAQLHDNPARREAMGACAAAAASHFDIRITSQDYLSAFTASRSRHPGAMA